MKRIIHISLMIMLVAGTFFLVSFADQKHRVQRHKSFEIVILNATDDALINEKEIREIIADQFGDIEGAMISMINLGVMEKMVRDNPYVSVCEVYQTISGSLIMKVRVRAPLVRIINDQGQQYFIDHSGYLLPVTFNHPSHVVVANGNITDRFISIDKTEKALSNVPDSSVLLQIYPVAMGIARDNFLKSFIDQIYINENKEIELVPKLGNQEIIFGTAENVPQKLENLKTFYLKVMNRLDWNTYKIINLKYNNQVVCSK
jgi:cell division protein FtsQ